MAKAVFERVFTIRGVEVYVEREAPEAFTAVQPAPEPLREPEKKPAEVKEVREIRRDVEAASNAVDAVQDSGKVLDNFLKKFDEELPGLVEMISRFCNYFEQAKAQNLPWQEKFAMERVGGELKKIFEKLAITEKTLKVDINGTLDGYDKTLEAFDKLAQKAGSFKEQLSEYYTDISGLKRSISDFASYFSNTLKSLNERLANVGSYLKKETRAENISGIVSDIIEDLKVASALAAKLHDTILPQLINLTGGSRKLFQSYDQFIEKVESSIAKPAVVVEPAPAEEFKGAASNTYLLMKNRVEANLRKLQYMSKMAYFMELVESDKSVSAAFPKLLKFYELFESVIESGKDEARKKRRIAWCLNYERKIVSYLERINALLFTLSRRVYMAGGADFDDYRTHLKKYKKTNPDFLVPGLTYKG